VFAVCRYPRGSYHPYGASSVDSSKLQRLQVTPEQLAPVHAASTKSALADASYYRTHSDYKWPVCKGHCESGACALKWDHPACCSVPSLADMQHDLHSGVQGSDSQYPSDAAEMEGYRHGSWVNHDLFCWVN